jgi:aspartate aminotransferase
MSPLSFDTGRDAPRTMSRMAFGLTGSEILRIAGEVRALKASGSSVLDLTVGDFDPKQFRIPAALESRIADALAKGETNYPPSNGMPALRDAIVRLFARDLGLDYPADGVVVAGGARPIIYATYRALVNPGDHVVYPVPSWNNNHYVHLTGAKGIPIETGPGSRFLPDAAMLRPHLRDARMLALCSPQNPTGTCFDAEGLKPICDLVLEENARRGSDEPPLYVMYDQVYWMLTFGGTRHVTPVGLDPRMAPWTIFVDGASKGFAATGLRVGWGVGPPAIIKRMSDTIGHMGAWAPRAEQVAVAGFLDDAAAMTEFRTSFHGGVRRRLELLHEGFQSMKAAGLPTDSIAPMGAIYLTVHIGAKGRTTPDGRVLASGDDVRRYLLEAAAFALVPFNCFASPSENWYRCSVGAVSEDDIRGALPRLRAALAALR